MQILRMQIARHLPLFVRTSSRQLYPRTPIAFLERFYPRSCGVHTTRQQTTIDKSQSSEIEESDYNDAIALLNQFQRYTPEKKGQRHPSAKERTKEWLSLLGCNVDTIQRPRVIHVAGSKGKGTTCYFCNQILNEHRRVTGEPKSIGCYTSPHQVEVRERIQINNEKIPKWLFSFYVRKLHNNIQSLTLQQGLATPPVPGYPGFLALLAIYIFILEGVEVAILETGIGGERDSTNIFPNPIATGITRIGLDHVKTLGSTVEQIAWHKAGIFKLGSPALVMAQDEAILEVCRKRAKEKHVAGELQVVTDRVVREYGVVVEPDMLYQRLNASLAISLAEIYLKLEFPRFSMDHDLASSLREAELPGRCQVVKDKGNTWFISVAHNEISLEETIAWFKSTIYGDTPRVLVFNQTINKSSPRDPYPLLKTVYDGLYENNAVTLEGVIFCTDQSDETGKEKPDLIDNRPKGEALASLNAQIKNAQIWRGLGGSGNISIVYTIRDAISLVREKYKGAEVLVTGSTFLASGVLHVLQPTSSVQ